MARRNCIRLLLSTVLLSGCVTTLEDVRDYRPSKKASFHGNASTIAQCTLKKLHEDPDPLALQYTLQESPNVQAVSVVASYHDLIPVFGEGVSFEARFVQQDPQTVAATFRDSDAKRLGLVARERIWPMIEWCAKP